MITAMTSATMAIVRVFMWSASIWGRREDEMSFVLGTPLPSPLDAVRMHARSCHDAT